MLEKIYTLGQKVVAFSPERNTTYTGQVIGGKWIEFSRGHFFKYQLLVGPGEVGNFHYYQVFEKDDWDGEKLKHHDSFHFELDAKQYGIDPAVAIDSIVEKLNALAGEVE